MLSLVVCLYLDWRPVKSDFSRLITILPEISDFSRTSLGEPVFSKFRLRILDILAPSIDLDRWITGLGMRDLLPIESFLLSKDFGIPDFLCVSAISVCVDMFMEGGWTLLVAGSDRKELSDWFEDDNDGDAPRLLTWLRLSDFFLDTELQFVFKPWSSEPDKCFGVLLLRERCCVWPLPVQKRNM